MMEHIIDTLLEKLELSRANLLYSGGGHCYLLLANTEDTLHKLKDWKKRVKVMVPKAFSK